MASKGHVIQIASDTGAYEKGIKSGVIEPTENARDALEKLADNRSGDKLAAQMQKAQRETKDLATETKRAADAIDDGFRDAYRKAAKSSDDATDKMKHGAEEFRDEAKQSAREAAASFDGSAASIGDLFQEVAANAFSGFGPAGLLAGIAAAGGIGAAIEGFNQVGQANEESQQRAAEWAQSYIDAGSLIIDSSTQVARMQDIATDPEKYKTAQENAKNWGVDVTTAMLAMSGNAGALEAAQTGLDDATRKVNRGMKDASGDIAEYAQGLTDLSVRTFNGKESLAQLRGEMESGSTAAQQVSEGFLRIVQGSADAAVEVDNLGNKLITLPDNTQVFIDAQTGVASQAVAQFKGDTDGMIDHVNGRQAVISVSADLEAAKAQIYGLLNQNLTKSIDVVINTVQNIGGSMR